MGDKPSGPETLVARVRADYREMPGRHLTLPQAQCLWGLDRPTCEAVLRALVDERCLHKHHRGGSSE